VGDKIGLKDDYILSGGAEAVEIASINRAGMHGAKCINPKEMLSRKCVNDRCVPKKSCGMELSK